MIISYSNHQRELREMNSLDPRWLSIELEAIQKEQEGWNQTLKTSYEVAIQRVIQHQARTAAEDTRHRPAATLFATQG